MATHSSTRGRMPRLAAALVAAGLMPAFAGDKTFDLGSGPVVLADVSAQVGVRFASMRFVPGQEVWLVEVSLANKSTLAVPTPLVLWVESFAGTTGPIGPDGTEGQNPPHAYYDFTAQTPDRVLWPGEGTLPRSLTLGYNIGAPSLVTRVYARTASLPSGLTLVRTLNEAGQPLPGVEVTETGPLGTSTKTTDPVFGLVTLGQGNGLHTWRFARPDYVPVWRRQSLAPGEVALTASPRLTRRAAGTTVPMAGGTVVNATVRIAVPPGAFAQDTLVTLTPLTGQTLPGFLPLGWSPLQAFWVEAPTEPAAPLSATIPLWGAIYGGESAALVRWNPSAVAWDVVSLEAGPATNFSVTLPGNGAFAVVVADGGSWPPPPAVVGKPLAGAQPPAIPYADLQAEGQVSPAFSIASRLPERVTGTATVVITRGSGELSSGLLLRSDIRENYELADASVRRTPRYETLLVGYQRPGDTAANTLHAAFPLRPLLLLGADELAHATIQAEVLPPEVTGQRVLGPNGGSASVGAVSVRAVPGDFASRQALYIRLLSADDLALLSLSNHTAVAGFDLGVTGIVSGRRLTLQVAGMPANSLFVLTRVLLDEGLFGLEPVERLASDSAGALSSLEPASGKRLPGIDRAGQYALVRVGAAQGLIDGIARNAAGQAAAGLPVRIADQPWLTLSGPGGQFQLVAPAGAAGVIVADPDTGDTGQTTVNVAAPNIPTSAQLGVTATGPRVLSLTPADGATNVARVTAVAVTFSEPIAPATLGLTGVLLLDANGQPVASSLTLNLAHTVATLLPVAQLPPSTRFTVRVSPSIADSTGLPLEGPTAFTFTTASDVLDRVPAQLTSYEPVNGMAVMVGSPGTADPESPVILVNESTGQTATILSKPDGSFSNAIPADVDDFLSAVLVNREETRNTIPVSRQLYRDGSVGLFHGGGVLEAESDGGPIQVIIQPGSIPNKTKFKLEAVPLTEVLALVSNTPPTGGKVLGGFRYSATEDALSEKPDVNFPIAVAELGLPPGVSPDQGTFALAVPRQIDGVIAYQMIDKMEYENGMLVTRSYPFLGLLVLAGSCVCTPITVGTGAPAKIAGQVLAGEVDAAGNLLNKDAAQRIAGASVTAFVGGVIEQPGWIAGGTVFAVSSSPNGDYALAVPAAAGGTSVSVFARHRDFARPTRPGSLLVHSGGAPVVRDLVFALADPGAVPDTTPPTLVFDYEPDKPLPTEPVIVLVRSTDDRATPSLDVYLQGLGSLDPEVPIDDLVVANRAGDELSADLTAALAADSVSSANATSVEKRYYFCANHPAEITLRVESSDGSPANPTLTNTYAIKVGATALAVPPGLPPSDPNDQTGPMVVWSYPPAGSASLRPGEAIRLRFSEAVTNAVLIEPEAFMLKDGDDQPVELSRIELDSGQIEVTLWFPVLKAGAEYELEVTKVVEDLVGNALDQDPVEHDGSNPDDPFTLAFETAPACPALPLPDLEAGAGIVMQGRYAYALDRLANGRGAVKIYDLAPPPPSAPQPTLVTNFWLSYPRDLKLIPGYAYRRTPDAAPETNDLLVVVGGIVGQSASQYLKVISISDPPHPTNVAYTSLTTSSAAVVLKVEWSPPVLGYLELGLQPAVGVVNLQKFIFGFHTRRDEYPDAFSHDPVDLAGVDANGDGDYVDEDDVLPRLPRTPTHFPGWEHAHIIPNTDQSIVDFSIQNGGDYVGVLVGAGHELDAQGKPLKDDDHAVPAAYRTLHYGEQELDSSAATFSFTEPDFQNAVLKRLTTLFALKLMVTNTTAQTEDLKLVDLALVSLNQRLPGETTTTPRLVVLDITNPGKPTLFAQVCLPTADTTGPYSIQQREDGMLVLALRDSLVLINPIYLGKCPANEVWEHHPAVLGVIPDIGSTHFSFFASRTGLIGASDGRHNEIVQLAPSLRFVQFTNVPPFLAETLTSLTDADLEERLAPMADVNALVLSRLEPVEGVVESTLTPPDPRTHYYVLLDAPGYAGETVKLAFESLNWAGEPLRNHGYRFAPVHALSAKALEDIAQTPADTDAPVTPAAARRLSSNPASRYYNLYLTQPIALIRESVTPDELDALKATGLDSVPRHILWSGHSLRAAIDPDEAGNTVLGSFAAIADTDRQQLVPGAMATAASFPGDTIVGPNPAPIGGRLSLPESLDMIDALSGGVRLSAEDLALPGRRQPLRLGRTFTAQDLYRGPFGRGWQLNHSLRVHELTANRCDSRAALPLYSSENLESDEVATLGDLLFVDGTGRNLVYHAAGGRAPDGIKDDPLLKDVLKWDDIVEYYTPPKGVFHYFVKRGDATLCRVDADGTLVRFNPAGQLATIEDRFGNRRTFQYGPNGRLYVIEDELRRQILFGYWVPSVESGRADLDEVQENSGSHGLMRCLKDYSGREVLYHYDDNGWLTSVEGPEVRTPDGLVPTDPPLVASFEERRVTSYSYVTPDPATDLAAQMLKTVAVAAWADVPFISITAYGAHGRDTVDTLDIGHRNYKITRDYDNRADAAAAGGKTITITSTSDQEASSITYDSHRYPSEIIRSGAGDPGLKTLYQFDANTGLLTLVSYPGGRKESYTYDGSSTSLRSRGNLLSVTKAPASDRGGDTLTAAFRYEPLYQLPKSPDPWGQHAHDFKTNKVTIAWEPAAGNDYGKKVVKRETANETLTEETTYNAWGQRSSYKAFDGTRRSWAYDADTIYVISVKEGDLETRYQYLDQSSGSTATKGPQLLGFPSRMVDANKFATTFLYNDLGQLLQANAGGALFRYAYDVNGNQIGRARLVVESPKTWVVETDAYNQFGFRTSHTVHRVETDDGTAPDLPTTYTPQTTHDRRLDTILRPDGQKVTMTYDGLGRLKRRTVTSPSPPDPDYVETHGYDAAGNLASVTVGPDGVGPMTSYTYDGHDRVFTKTTPSNLRSITHYDGNDNVRTNQALSDTGAVLSQTRYTYDSLDRVLEVRRARGDGSQETRPYTHTYSTASRSISVEDPLGAVSSLTYDTAGRTLTTVDPTATVVNYFGPADTPLDLESRTVTFTESGLTASLTDHYFYNDRHQLTEHRDNRSQSTFYEDADQPLGLDGRVHAIRDRESHSRTFTFTRLGEPASKTDANDVTLTYRYDRARHRTSTAAETGGSLGTAYDAGGRLQKLALPNGTPGETTFADFNERNLPQTVTHPRGIKEIRTYYPAGTLHTRSFTGGGGYQESFTYDELDRPKTIDVPAGYLELHYDALGYANRMDYKYRDTDGLELLTFTLEQSAYDNLQRQSFTYAKGGPMLSYQREANGRLTSLATTGTDATIIQSTTYKAGTLASARVLGSGVIRLSATYDDLLRPTKLEYTQVAGGGLLAGVRYGYSPEGMIVEREFLHRGGAKDNLDYDGGYRLTRAQLGVLPGLPSSGYT